MSRVFWDTNLFIYLLDGRGSRNALVANLRRSMIVRGDELFTSALTIGEVLVKPMQLKNRTLANKYAEVIASAATILHFDEKAATEYALIRCDRSIKPPDAIQLACAAALGVDLFITNDERLHSKQVEGVQFIVPLERAPL